MQLNRSTDYAIQMLLYLAKAGKTVSSLKLQRCSMWQSPV